MAAQDRAVSDARAASTAIAQANATSTAQAKATAKARAKAATATARASGSSNAYLLKAAVTNMKAAKSYYLDLSISQSGQDIKVAGDIDVTNNKAKLDMSTAGLSISMISIGSKSYLSMDGGKTYIENPTGTDSGLNPLTKMWDNFKPEEVDRAKTALRNGNPADEKVGNDDTHHVTADVNDLGSLSLTSGSTMTGTIDIWVTTGDRPTVRKMRIMGTSDGSPTDATLEWSNVNQSVIIEAPPMTTPEPIVPK
jgi:hypothetical protein